MNVFKMMVTLAMGVTGKPSRRCFAVSGATPAGSADLLAPSYNVLQRFIAGRFAKGRRSPYDLASV